MDPTNLQPTCNQLATDCISRQAAIDAVRHSPIIEVQPAYMLIDKADVLKNIVMLPSAQHTGRWIVVSDGYGNGEATACICECSECKDTIWVYKKSDRKWKYCPNCGARMEE